MTVIDIANIAIAVATLVVTMVIYRLGKRLGMRARMTNRETIAAKVWELSNSIRTESINSQVILMNSFRYERGDYPSKQARPSIRGEMFQSGEMTEVRHDGVEFIISAKQTWLDRRGRRTFRKSERQSGTALAMGFVAFDAVDYVNLDGDEFFNKPIFYVRFESSEATPFRRVRWTESGPYTIRSGGMEYYRSIDELGTVVAGGVPGVVRRMAGVVRSSWYRRRAAWATRRRAPSPRAKKRPTSRSRPDPND